MDEEVMLYQPCSRLSKKEGGEKRKNLQRHDGRVGYAVFYILTQLQMSAKTAGGRATLLSKPKSNISANKGYGNGNVE